jgi:hypothetical protein
MNHALKTGLMKIKGYAMRMKGEGMKGRMTHGKGEEQEGPNAVTPGVDNHEESTEVDPRAGTAVPSEAKHAPKETIAEPISEEHEVPIHEIHKMLGIKKPKK